MAGAYWVSLFGAVQEAKPRISVSRMPWSSGRPGFFQLQTDLEACDRM